MPTSNSTARFRVPGYFVVAPKKLIILAFFTFGLYSFFCFHRNWVHQRRVTGDRSWPLMRALVMIVYFYPLLRRVNQSLHQQGAEQSLPACLLCVLYILAVLPLLLLDSAAFELFWGPAILLSFSSHALAIWVGVRIQEAINVVEQDPKGLGNARLSWVNWLWMMPGLAFWLLVVLRAALSFLGAILGAR